MHVIHNLNITGVNFGLGTGPVLRGTLALFHIAAHVLLQKLFRFFSYGMIVLHCLQYFGASEYVVLQWSCLAMLAYLPARSPKFLFWGLLDKLFIDLF